PVGRLRRRVAAAADEAVRERRRIPRERKRERADRVRQRPPAPEGKRQYRKRHGGEAQARDVLAEARRDRVGGNAGDRVGREDRAEDARSLDTPGEREAEPAERQRGQELGGRERKTAAGGEEPPEQECDRADGADRDRRLSDVVSRSRG